LLLICASAVGADSPPERRVQQEVNAALVRLLANGEVSDADLAAMRLRHDGGRIARFGALLSATQGVRGRSGAEVIAVTPGGSAESMGLVPGDFIVGVNGAAASGGSLSSDSHPDPSEFIRAQLDQSIGDVSLLVERDGRELVLAGPILSVQLPAYRLDLGAAITQSALGDVSDPQQ